MATRTLDWVRAALGDPDGGFASALDADTDGHEGLTYVWTPAQVRALLSEEDAAAAIEWFGLTEEGNFEDGTTVLESRGIVPPAEQAERIRTTLLAARDERPQPARDDKRIVSWNALTISALATSGALLGRADDLAAAERCADLILGQARDARGRLLRLIPLEGADRTEIPAGVLDDHAHLLAALLALYEATFHPRWFTAATELAEVLLRDFADPERGGFFATADDHERLVVRRKEVDDSPIPSGQATAAGALLRLHALTGESEYLEAAEGVLRVGARFAAEAPSGFGEMLSALDQYLSVPREIAIVGSGPAAEALLAVARTAPRSTVLAATEQPTDAIALLAGRDLVDGKPAAYLCERMSCRQPITDPAELQAALADA